jgi:endonuclease
MGGKIARIWEALDACFTANKEPLTKAQVFAWINNVYKGNDFHPGTLYHQLRRSCANRPSAANYNTPKILIFDENTKTFTRVNAEQESANSAADTSQRKYVQNSVDDDEADELGDSTFALEGHLRDYLAKNLAYLEKGLQLWSVSPPSVEFVISGRRVDILAKDKDGCPVIIELKLNKGYDRVIGQALLYQVLVSENLKAEKVRIMLVANSVSDELKKACSRQRDVTLFEYSISMQVQKVNPSQTEES